MPNALVVDDSKIVRSITRKILEGFHYTIEEAEDGQKALEACERQMPDLIMLDWHMPVMNGLEFLKEIRSTEAGKAPMIIFCTTESEFSKIQEAVMEGANEYVMKPFDDDIIRGKLQQLGLL